MFTNETWKKLSHRYFDYKGHNPLFQRSLSLEQQHFFLDLIQLYYWRTNALYENTMFTNKQNAALLGKENSSETRGGVGKE
jgi:hypothetical protein